MKRLIIGISGASGVIYGIRILQILKGIDEIETHLVITKGGKLNISLESDFSLKEIESMADVVHNDRNLGASIASGSFETSGMIVAPCSMKTLSGIVNSYATNLIVRAADVILKETRQLIIVPRETPLHLGHTELLYKASLMGADIVPPNPALMTLLITQWDVFWILLVLIMMWLNGGKVFKRQWLVSPLQS